MTSDVSLALSRLRADDSFDFDDLFAEVYDRLRGLASRLHRRSPGRGSLHTTCLVHEAYMKLRRRPAAWSGSGHFLATCATAMRHILIDSVRRGRRLRRDAHLEPLVDQAVRAQGAPQADLLALDEAIDRMAEAFPRQARVVELRFFAGLTNREVAEVLEVDTRTVERDWKFARAWLRKTLD